MIRRLYDPKHIPKLIGYARQWHAKSALAGIPIDTPRATAMFRQSLMAEDAAVWVSWIDKKVRGFLVGVVLDWPALEGKFMTDLYFLADRDGVALYKAFVQWGTAHGATSIQMGVSSGLPQAGKFYEAMGLKNVGGIYFGATT